MDYYHYKRGHSRQSGTSDGTDSKRNMDAALSTLDTKLIQLQFARERTEETIQSKRCDKIERQIKALKELSGEADQLKKTIEGMKIADKESAEEVKKWNDQIEEKITKADDDVLRLEE